MVATFKPKLDFYALKSKLLLIQNFVINLNVILHKNKAVIILKWF